MNRLGSLLRCAARVSARPTCEQLAQQPGTAPSQTILNEFKSYTHFNRSYSCFGENLSKFPPRAAALQVSNALGSSQLRYASAKISRSVVPNGLTVARSLLTRGFSSSVSLEAAHPLVKGGSKAESQIFWWLAGSSAWVFSMVVLGGVTRLTRSGLSMTDWKFTGGMPPMTPEEWEAEFNKYKQSPEYHTVNLGMDVEAFKGIYWLEYAHRMWGRFLGLGFLIPGSYFAYKGYITPKLGLALATLFTMGGMQGLVGWWMVKSGLEQPKPHQEARVSPYRLAAHLTSAFLIYTGLLWTTLSVAYPQAASAAASTTQDMLQGLGRARGFLLPLSGLIAVTAVSGAFVAGLDAGRAYNSFPLMNGSVVPAEYWDLQQFPTLLENTFENTAAVQFHHRVLALTTLTSVTGVWHMLRNTALPARTGTLLHCMVGMTWAQVALGITTLLTYVPVSLGAAHQAGALTLMTFAVATLHSVRKVNAPAVARGVASQVQAQGGFAASGVLSKAAK